MPVIWPMRCCCCGTSSREGEVRQAISVVKKRGGLHERTIREFAMRNGTIRVGEVLREFRGVLTGVPVYEGPTAPLVGTERRK